MTGGGGGNRTHVHSS